MIPDQKIVTKSQGFTVIHNEIMDSIFQNPKDSNPDTTFSYDLTSDAKLSEGEHTMRVQYGSSKVTVEQTSFMISSSDSVSLEKADTETRFLRGG